MSVLKTEEFTTSKVVHVKASVDASSSSEQHTHDKSKIAIELQWTMESKRIVIEEAMWYF